MPLERKPSVLEILLSVYAPELPLDETIRFEAISPELSRLVALGDSVQARFLLDAYELRFGPWNKAEEHSSIAFCHLLILLCENDLPAARFLCKRCDKNVLSPNAFAVYEKLWRGDDAGAVDSLASLPCANAVEQAACALLLAKLRARELVHFAKAYTRVSVETLGKCLGLQRREEVQRFCDMSPPNSRFEFDPSSGFVNISMQSAAAGGGEEVVGEEVKKKIDLLMRAILTLQSEAGTFISLKSSAATPQQQQQ